MGHLVRLVVYLWLLAGMPVVAQQAPRDDAATSVSTVSPGPRATSLKWVTVYLRRADGRWSASLSEDINDPATEKVEVSLNEGTVKDLARRRQNGDGPCLTKMKDRTKFGYLDCNSAFYSANAGSTAAATIIRGIFTLGIATVADAASGNTGFTVSLDQEALDTAVAESKAIEFARESAQLIEYREAFDRAYNSRRLRDFIVHYEGVFDPEMLVAKAKEKLPAVTAQENAQAQQQLAAAAERAEAAQQKELQRQAELQALRQFQARLRPGDRVMMKFQGGDFTAYGMIVETKPPLAYLQWENVTPAMQWVRLESLLPPK